MAKDYGVVSTADLHGIRVAAILVLFWVAVWNLAEECMKWFENRYDIPRWKMNLILLLLVLLIIIVDPYTFEKL
jgi:uncharacterized membrane protein